MLSATRATLAAASDRDGRGVDRDPHAVVVGAGVNTEMARRQMLQNMSMGIAKGQGGGAVGFAQAITSTNVSYGRDYAA